MPPNNIIPLPESEGDLKQQAMRWVVRLNSGETSKGDRLAFSQWIQQDAEHRKAFFDARRLWRQMDQLNPAGLDQAPFEVASTRALKPAKQRKRPLYQGAALVMILAGLVLIRPLYLRYIVADYRTAVGESKSVLLPDGSSAYLNTDSLIAEHYSEKARNIEVLAGEVEFEVARDKSRPFIVTAGNGKTRALGTRFVVKYVGGTVRVSVLEHAVEISSENHAPVTLHTGYKLEYGSKGLLDIPKAFAESEADAWKNGKLKYNARPLKEVIAEIDRYLPGKIVLANGDFAGHRVSGLFEINNLTGAIAVIAQSLHLQTASVGTLLYVIY